MNISRTFYPRSSLLRRPGQEEAVQEHRVIWRPSANLPAGFREDRFLTTRHSLIPIIQVCVDWPMAKKLLGDRLRWALDGKTQISKWIPILVGYPESEEYMVESILVNGCWVNPDIHNSRIYLEVTIKVRDFIENEITPLICKCGCLNPHQRDRLIRETRGLVSKC